MLDFMVNPPYSIAALMAAFTDECAAAAKKGQAICNLFFAGDFGRAADQVPGDVRGIQLDETTPKHWLPLIMRG
jgi:hypothetical protein